MSLRFLGGGACAVALLASVCLTPAAAHPYDQYIRGRSFFGAMFGPSIARMVVSYPTNQKTGTIVISTAQRRLYLVLGNGQALSYAIAVGAAGYAWSGVNQVTDKPESRCSSESTLPGVRSLQSSNRLRDAARSRRTKSRISPSTLEKISTARST
jgi:hypothetical protein